MVDILRASSYFIVSYDGTQGKQCTCRVVALC